MNSKFIRSLIIGSFVAVPLLSSIISTIHLVDMYYLGNPNWLAVTIAIAIEIGAVASFLTLSILNNLNKTIVWSMFFLLFILQVWGNVYYSYDWVTQKILIDPNWLSTFKEMMEFFSYEMSMETAKMILAMIVGIPIPLMSLMLLKSLVDYIGKKDTIKTDDIAQPIQETIEENTDILDTVDENESLKPEEPEEKIIESKQVKKDLSSTYFEELQEKKT